MADAAAASGDVEEVEAEDGGTLPRAIAGAVADEDDEEEDDEEEDDEEEEEKEEGAADAPLASLRADAGSRERRFAGSRRRLASGSVLASASVPQRTW